MNDHIFGALVLYRQYRCCIEVDRNEQHTARRNGRAWTPMAPLLDKYKHLTGFTRISHVDNSWRRFHDATTSDARWRHRRAGSGGQQQQQQCRRQETQWRHTRHDDDRCIATGWLRQLSDWKIHIRETLLFNVWYKRTIYIIHKINTTQSTEKKHKQTEKQQNRCQQHWTNVVDVS